MNIKQIWNNYRSVIIVAAIAILLAIGLTLEEAQEMIRQVYEFTVSLGN